MKRILLSLLSCLLLIGIVSCGNNKSTSDTDTTDTVNTTAIKKKSITEKMQEATTIDEVKQLLNGTTWHYTENLDNSEIGCWIKVEFNGNNYTTYYALPSEGQWTKAQTGTYTVKECRYVNTGKKYISIHWDGSIKNPQLGIILPCDMAFTSDDFGLRVHSPQMDAVLYDGRGMMKQIIMNGTMEYGDYKWN